MPSILERFAGLFRSSPPQSDSVKMEALWCNRAPKAVRRLGTIGEARRIIAAASAKDVEYRRQLIVVEKTLVGYCERENELRAEHEPPLARLGGDDELGDPHDVHHIVPPAHLIGYAIEESEDGFALETLETLYMRWQILRLRDKIIGIDSVGMLRQESYGNHNVL